MSKTMGKEMLKEQWLRHFCTDDECRQLLEWLRSEGLSRPRGFEDRLEHAAHLRELGNDWYKKGDFRRALHCMLGAIHSLDVKPAEQLEFDEQQQLLSARALLPVLSNLAMILLMRGDFENADRAATSGLRCAKKLPTEESAPMRAKLHYRRALARGEPGPSRNLEGAREDLLKAAQLEPTNREVRACLDKCKEFLKGGGEAPATTGKEGEPATGAPAGATGGGPTNGPAIAQEPIELRAAECIGRCLGRCLRRCRKVHAHLHRALGACRCSGASPRWLVTVALGPLLSLTAVWLLAYSEPDEVPAT